MEKLCLCRWRCWEWRKTAPSVTLPTPLAAPPQTKTLLRSYITDVHCSGNYTLHHAPLVSGLTLTLSDISITPGSPGNTESRISDKTCCCPAAFYRLESWKTHTSPSRERGRELYRGILGDWHSVCSWALSHPVYTLAVFCAFITQSWDLYPLITGSFSWAAL